MNRTRDATGHPHTIAPFGDAPADDEPWTDVNEAAMAEAQADAVTDVHTPRQPDRSEPDDTAPMTPFEEIKRKYGPDILRPASQFPRKVAT